MAAGNIVVTAATENTAAAIDTAMTASIAGTNAAALISTVVVNNTVFCIAKEV